MTSTDKQQVSHIIHVLDQLIGSLNPVNVISSLVAAIEAVALVPPGDPGKLRVLADAFDVAGRDAGQLAADVRALGGQQLPQAWSGLAGASASRVVVATADLVDAVPPAFNVSARSLREHANTVESLQARHHELYRQLREAWHDATHSTVFGVQVTAPDLFALSALVERAIDLFVGCQRIYRDSLDAADALEGHLADAKGRARAQADLRAGRSPAAAVVLADLAVGPTGTADNAILTPAQADQAARRRDQLSPADQARLDALLAQAGSPEEQAYLLKAFAAGHSLDEVATFAGQIHGRTPDWLRTHLSLVNAGHPGSVEYAGYPVKQTDETTCGSTSILIARAYNDPMYAFQLTTGGQPDDPAHSTGAAFYARINAEEQRIHHATNLLWPESLGTTPWGATAELNRHADELGTSYDWHIVDDTDSRSVNPALRDAVTAVDSGHPVPVLIGDSYPGHYVLMIGHDGDNLVFYNPSGEITQVSERQFLDGKLDDLGFAHVQGVITPTG